MLTTFAISPLGNPRFSDARFAHCPPPRENRCFPDPFSIQFPVLRLKHKINPTKKNRIYFTFEPTAWLSELVDYREYIISSIQNLQTVVIVK